MKDLLRMNLQYFAEEGDAAESTEETTEQEETESSTEEEPEKKYSDDDVNKIIDQKFAKWQKEQEKKEEEAKKEAQMTAEEKAENDRKKQESKIAELEAASMQKDLKYEALKSGVPDDKMEKFLKLAGLSESEEVADKVKETLEEFPEFVPKVEEETTSTWPNITKKGDYKGNGSNSNDPFKARLERLKNNK